MLLNKGYLESQGDEIYNRALKWASIVLSPEELAAAEQQTDVSTGVVLTVETEAGRIIMRDAERTFMVDEDRQKFARFLTVVQAKFLDYAQGMSFLTGTLLLFLPEGIVLAMLTKINSDTKYIPGYWKHEAVAFARDAYVFDNLLRQRNSALATHLSKSGALPETYTQKYFVALCIHVLPFEPLFQFLENFFKFGARYLFQFALSFVQHMEKLLTSASDAPTVFAYLRLDTKMITYPEEIPMQAVRAAEEVDISDIDSDEKMAALREKIFNEKLKSRFDALAAAKAREEEEKRKREEKKRQKEENGDDGDDSDEDDDSDFDSDDDGDDGVECMVCESNWPEYYCKECNLLICGMCHEKRKGTHVAAHKVRTATNADFERFSQEKELAAKLEATKISD